ncbi:MAG: hypothetical protein LBL26_02205 [Peptococcaceae bacterium]|nr:hypothetical protein [Peptococcaceae bacterium]
MKKTWIAAVIFLWMVSAVPVWGTQSPEGAAETVSAPAESQVKGSETGQEAFKDPRTLFKEARKRLLQAQSEIVRQANDAKNRVELILNEYLESVANKTGFDTNIEDLKKDLEKVKESQKNVTGIIKEVKTVLDQELDPKANLNSPDYLQTLTVVYIEKAALLEKEAEILSKIARPPGEINITPTPAPVSETAAEG